MPVEIDGNDRYFELLNEADDAGLPLSVLDVQVVCKLAHSPCWEESQRVALTHMSHGLCDATHAHCSLGRVVALQGIDGNEVGPHGADVVQYHIDHHLEVVAALADELDEHDAVQCTEGVVAHGDERSLWQVVQHLLASHFDGDVQVVEQALHKGHSRRVTVVVVYPVDLVDGEHARQEAHQPRLAVKPRHHLSYVVVVEYGSFNRLSHCIFELWAAKVQHFFDMCDNLSDFLLFRALNFIIFCSNWVGEWAIMFADANRLTND